MGIGPDIAEVLNELGTLVNIIKHDGSATVQEYLDYEISIEATNSFISQYTLLCTLIYNSAAADGDIIQFDDDDSYYLLTALAKTRFEQSIVTIEGILLRCNMIGTFSRKSTTRTNYELTSTWGTVKTSEPVLITGAIDTKGILLDEVHAQFSVMQDDLYVSNGVEVQVGDRFTNSSGTQYEILATSPNFLRGIIVCRVRIDTRE